MKATRKKEHAEKRSKKKVEDLKSEAKLNYTEPTDLVPIWVEDARCYIKVNKRKFDKLGEALCIENWLKNYYHRTIQ